jgi:hypothetical protein
MFPFSITGAIDLPPGASNPLHAVANGLTAHCSSVKIVNHKLEFTSDWQKTGRYGILFIVTHGVIWVEPGTNAQHLRYVGNTTLWFVFATLLSGTVALAGTLVYDVTDVVARIAGFFFVFSVVFGLNYCIAYVRFRRFILAGLGIAPRPSHNSK